MSIEECGWFLRIATGGILKLELNQQQEMIAGCGLKLVQKGKSQPKLKPSG